MLLAPGVNPVPETLPFTAQDSGRNGFTVIWNGVQRRIGRDHQQPTLRNYDDVSFTGVSFSVSGPGGVTFSAQSAPWGARRIQTRQHPLSLHNRGDLDIQYLINDSPNGVKLGVVVAFATAFVFALATMTKFFCCQRGFLDEYRASCSVPAAKWRRWIERTGHGEYP
ncbi:hypothetical protein QBC40DRAFT_293759 [Triangularia verruculosa]|uniref:Uncharacterized protein n=1 Tax=Triangularia verruculosa TaxID=2587418 RepID=A0AAN6XM67_9PEZI|nr:hypothetical protein QBC40DRAFT_293759 [Triangularia verruculosa]